MKVTVSAVYKSIKSTVSLIFLWFNESDYCYDGNAKVDDAKKRTVDVKTKGELVKVPSYLF